MPENTAPASASVKKRIDHIDTMRGMCILFVNYFHSNISLLFLQYVSTICVHPFLFIGGYFYNDKKDLKDTFHKRLRTMIFPYYVFGLAYYVIWAAAFYGTGRDIISPLRAVLYMPTGDFPIEPSIYFLPMMFSATMIFGLIVKYIKPELLRFLVVAALTYIGDSWTTYFSFRLPMSLDCALAVLIYLYLGYHGRAIIALCDRALDAMKPYCLRFAVLCTAAVLNYVCIISNFIPNIRNGNWSNIPVTHLNTCVTMLLWVYFFRWFEKPRAFAPVRRFLKYIGENSMTFMCFSHVGLYIGLFAADRLPVGGTLHDVLYLVIGTLAVFPIVFVFNKTKLHRIFGK